jgi:hypothetical protein
MSYFRFLKTRLSVDEGADSISLMCAVTLLNFLFHHFPFSIESVIIMTSVVIPLSGMFPNTIIVI